MEVEKYLITQEQLNNLSKESIIKICRGCNVNVMDGWLRMELYYSNVKVNIGSLLVAPTNIKVYRSEYNSDYYLIGTINGVTSDFYKLFKECQRIDKINQVL